MVSLDQSDSKANRLIQEKSPYLLQHAYNPVDWYPWGEEAFEKAERENKPVMVSIGYSTCHWCHVMERESFEDEKVAKLLNERFVAIKVDREERPDIDNIYMKVVQGITGQGGWPLHAFLTPDQKPFYGGVYFPKKSRYGQPGFIDVITQLYNQYKGNPEKIKDIGEKITNALQEKMKVEHGEQLDEKILRDCYSQLSGSFDMTHGGFGQAPKFPTPPLLTFLLKYHRWSNDGRALHFVTKTLDSMADGGIYDHVGYGFARYSVDEKWLVPHFEKMLYDNALLANTYIDAYTATANEVYKRVAKEVLSYVQRDMTDPACGFYSAEDADSEGEEGKFYVWSKEEIIVHLGEETGQLFCEVYDITDEGNFEGKNIPNLIDSRFDEIAEKQGISTGNLMKKMGEAMQVLYGIRKKRVHPHKDDKILTSWNGYMIASFAKAGRVFANDKYTETAEQAYRFVEENLIEGNRLKARFREGQTAYDGYLDDYANFVWASIELYETTFEIRYLRNAKQFTDDMIRLFWDEESGGFYFSGHDSEQLILRPKELHDGATPSGNSVAANQLWKLAKLTGETKYEERLDKLFTVFSEDVSHYPSGAVHLLEAFILTKLDGKEVVVIGPDKGGDRQSFIKKINRRFLPEVTIHNITSGSDLADIAPFAREYKPIEDNTTVYLCKNFACDRPTTDIDEVLAELR
ncbi:thioredoxin domain-containing protein [Pseudalkalibacillus sp. A8]|uniref:thioredoxin domain-containing protein n=1 Tax=Pseudalkalibacillus sp. A8 TaxID=3382641 RepID=UPI0038B52D74